MPTVNRLIHSMTSRVPLVFLKVVDILGKILKSPELDTDLNQRPLISLERILGQRTFDFLFEQYM